MKPCDAFAGRRVVFNTRPSNLDRGRRSQVNAETLANQPTGRRTDSFEPDDASGTPLPNAYGTDTFVFMVRDPTRAHAYWEICVARIKDAVASLGGGKAFLRLIGVPTGYLLAEEEVCAARGSHDVALPEADHSYAAELAIVHRYRKVLLARSDVVQAPPSMPRPAAVPAFASRGEQRRALQLGLTLEGRAGEPSALLQPSIGGASIAQGSEARLLRLGSERRLARLG
jgi:hypothetical protein